MNGIWLDLTSIVKRLCSAVIAIIPNSSYGSFGFDVLLVAFFDDSDSAFALYCFLAAAKSQGGDDTVGLLEQKTTSKRLSNHISCMHSQQILLRFTVSG